MSRFTTPRHRRVPDSLAQRSFEISTPKYAHAFLVPASTSVRNLVSISRTAAEKQTRNGHRETAGPGAEFTSGKKISRRNSATGPAFSDRFPIAVSALPFRGRLRYRHQIFTGRADGRPADVCEISTRQLARSPRSATTHRHRENSNAPSPPAVIAPPLRSRSRYRHQNMHTRSWYQHPRPCEIWCRYLERRPSNRLVTVIGKLRDRARGGG
jgi:hypothetical protein